MVPLLLLVALLCVQQALACGGFFCSFAQPVVQAGENILFSMEEGKVTATVQIKYSGEAEDFSWVLPLPSVPTDFAVSSDQLFTSLHRFTDPQFTVTLNQPECGFEQFPCPLAAPDRGFGSEVENDDGSVDVIAMGEVGPFIYTVIAAKAGDEKGVALFNWLNDNGFDQPDSSKPIIERYVQLQHKFVTLKLQKGKSAGELVPIVLKYPAPLGNVDISCIPLRLTSIAATEDMPIFVWVAGKSRAVPQNFLHLEPDFGHMPWHKCMNSDFGGAFFAPSFLPFGGTNRCNAEYRELLRLTAERFTAKKWLTTEFAGEPPAGLFDSIWNRDSPSFVVSRFAEITDASDFLSALRGALPGDLSRSAQTQAMIRKHMPMPASAEADEQCSSEQQFYSIGGECLKQYVSTFDAAAFASDVDTALLGPLKETRDELERHPYITRFFSEISPDSMNRDPVFRFAPDGKLPPVSHIHTANATYTCPETRDDTFDLLFTLPDGSSQTVAGARIGSCGGVTVPDDVDWQVTRGGFERLGVDDEGALVRTTIADSAAFAQQDMLLEDVDLIPAGVCNKGTMNCQCAEGDVCASGLACSENLCVPPSTATTNPSATTTAAQVGSPEEDSAQVVVLATGAIVGGVAML